MQSKCVFCSKVVINKTFRKKKNNAHFKAKKKKIANAVLGVKMFAEGSWARHNGSNCSLNHPVFHKAMMDRPLSGGGGGGKVEDECTEEMI